MPGTPVSIGPFDATNIVFTPAQTGGIPLDLAQILTDLDSASSFGAVGDAVVTAAGVVTSGTDDTAAIQAALNAAATNSASTQNPNWDVALGLSVDWDLGDGSNANNLPQGVVTLKRGHLYRISQTLNIPVGVRFDLNNSVLLMTSTETAINYSFPDVDVNPPTQKNYTGGSGGAILNGYIWGPGKTVSQGIGVDVAAQGYELRNLVIGGFLCGTHHYSCQYALLQNVYCVGNVVNGLFTGSDKGTIDIRIDNCRFAKGSGYGLWLHHATNITGTQIDCNFAAKAHFVFGRAVPDYLSQKLAFTPGAGYTPGTYPLTISDSVGAGVTGYTTVGPNGVVTSACITDGLGVGAGVSDSPSIVMPTSAGTPTTAATFTPSLQRDGSSAIGSLVKVTDGAGCGLINLHNAKAEVGASRGDNGTNPAPDCGYQVVATGSEISFHNRNFSSYALSATNYYRAMFLSGATVCDYDPEFTGQIENPGASGDYGLYRAINTSSITSPLRIRLSHDINTSNIGGLVIGEDGTSTSAVGTEVLLSYSRGDSYVVPHIVFQNGAFPTNPRLEISNPGEAGNRFQIDGNGNMSWGSGAASADLSLAHTGIGQLTSTGGFLTNYLGLQQLSDKNADPQAYFTYPAAVVGADANSSDVVLYAMWATDKYLYRINSSRHIVRIPWSAMPGDTPANAGTTQ